MFKNLSSRKIPYPGLIPASTLAKANGITLRTLFNWVRRGILPVPTKINGRKYFGEGTNPKTDNLSMSTGESR